MVVLDVLVRVLDEDALAGAARVVELLDGLIDVPPVALLALEAAVLPPLALTA